MVVKAEVASVEGREPRVAPGGRWAAKGRVLLLIAV
jgi:hypothetical protein